MLTNNICIGAILTGYDLLQPTPVWTTSVRSWRTVRTAGSSCWTPSPGRAGTETAGRNRSSEEEENEEKIEEKIESREEGEVKDEDFSGENSYSWCCVIL